MTAPFVSLGLPVRNGAATVGAVVKSVLDQDHNDLELVITDNASDDATEEICREFARSDERIRYVRQKENIGLINNFTDAIHRSRGQYFRWIGDGDWIARDYVSRCLHVFAEDEGLILVSTQLEYELADDAVVGREYRGSALRSADPATRFAEMLRLLTSGVGVLDPLYSLMRRETAVRLPRRCLLREDELFAAELALAGPWGHVPAVLASRDWAYTPLSVIARRFGIPGWQTGLATPLQSRDLLRAISEADLTAEQAARARLAVARLFGRRVGAAAQRARRKATRLLTAPVAMRNGSSPPGRVE